MGFEGPATLKDLASRLSFDKQYQKIVETQSQTNKILEDMLFMQCNTKDAHEVTRRYELPAVAWRMINQGVAPTGSKTEQAKFSCGHMEAFAQIDERMYKKNGSSDAWRLGENAAFQQAMNKEMATTLFYGDEKTNPAGFTGLGAYYYSKTAADVPAIYKDQIIDAGGTGNNLTSLYLVGWGEQTVFGIYEEGTKAGFTYEDKGKQAVIQDGGKKYYALESQYMWDMGLCLRDPKYVVRVANIDLANLTDTQTLLRNLIEGYNQIEDPDSCKLSIYCNRKVMTLIDILAQDKKNVNLTIDTFNGQKITHFWGAPFRRCDGILNTESEIV